MDEKVDEYIKKQKSPQRQICQKLREIILKTIPDINEEMKVGVPCYGSTKQDLCGKYYIAALKDHVNLGFYSDFILKIGSKKIKKIGIF